MKILLIIVLMLALLLFRSCGITFQEELLSGTVHAIHPVEDEIEDADTGLNPKPTETGLEGTPSTPVATTAPALTTIPAASPEVAPEAASTPEASVTPLPDTGAPEEGGAAGQDYTGSLLGEPDTDF